MPLPMVHLGVADRYFEGGRIPDAFVLGSIAPDAIHRRAGTGREDKLRTHFGGKETTPEQLETYYALWIGKHPEEEWKRYVQGYFAHVLTDYLWGIHVYAEFKRQVWQDGVPEAEIKQRYYVDTDGIDFWLYETAPWKEQAWESLLRTPAYAMDPLLTEREVDEWRLRTLRWFEEPAHKPDVPPRFLTPDIVDGFIRRTGDEVRTILGEWEKRLSLPAGSEGLS
ncbi:hypothetical protein [Saccharibacillus qingshengii]|uniref:hypothetical protein n=1 Tax=Saccharibacillus qingshengii TaxID=1763540 RepID=UPI0015583436|nr:hypothetical protein [Saccharibacillus qingshengii]